MNKELIEVFFPDAYKAIESGKCPECLKDVDMNEEFKENEKGFKEYLISGLCSDCQDKVFEDKNKVYKQENLGL